MKGILTRQGDGLMVKEMATMKEPEWGLGCPPYLCNPDSEAVKNYNKAIGEYREYIAGLKSIPAVGFSEEMVGKEVEYELEYQESLPFMRRDEFVTCTKEQYDEVDPPYRRIVAIPADSVSEQPVYRSAEGVIDEVIKKLTTDIKYAESIKLTPRGKGEYHYAKILLHAIQSRISAVASPVQPAGEDAVGFAEWAINKRYWYDSDNERWYKLYPNKLEVDVSKTYTREQMYSEYTIYKKNKV